MVPDVQRNAARAPSSQHRAAIAETALQQAFRRGDFDGLPGAGKPLTNLHEVHDPDWWIRKKSEREELTGLGPPALALRTESAGLEAQLDGLHLEADVRSVLEDVNRRVVEARRQLLGGPPVVTKTRDVEADLQQWWIRRNAAAEQRRRAEAAADGPSGAAKARGRTIRRPRAASTAASRGTGGFER